MLAPDFVENWSYYVILDEEFEFDIEKVHWAFGSPEVIGRISGGIVVVLTPTPTVGISDVATFHLQWRISTTTGNIYWYFALIVEHFHGGNRSAIPETHVNNDD